ncbi:hypothetical protein MSG28_011007 [Choristoneura fumiferana]|uniref:Uncharacterized protein n=1 Tax=Choristoneura fumiferana TaxID=7141 RepID=A0ACC0KQF2_CHOFU|nr:hypothetical protein MSG28_011007 [Choristoneura fumiferana]
MRHERGNGASAGAGAGAGGAGLARRPPAPPRARVSGSQRSLLSVASDSAAARRPRDIAPRHYPHPADAGFSLFRHASNNNILVGESTGGSLARRHARVSRGDARETREARDHNANLARTHARIHRHDNTLDIILKPLIESTQAIEFSCGGDTGLDGWRQNFSHS